MALQIARLPRSVKGRMSGEWTGKRRHPRKRMIQYSESWQLAANIAEYWVARSLRAIARWPGDDALRQNEPLPDSRLDLRGHFVTVKGEQTNQQEQALRS
jgi:hypothetical protein